MNTSRRMHRVRLIIVASLLWAPLQACAFQRLDDSASPRARVPAQAVLAESGRPLADSPFVDVAIVRFGRVEYKLATAPYAGRHARIYLVVPMAVPGLRSPQAVQLDWRGGVRFAPGSGRPGDRMPVWSGRVSEAWMTEVIELTARVQLDQVEFGPDGQFGFEVFFEIEELP